MKKEAEKNQPRPKRSKRKILKSFFGVLFIVGVFLLGYLTGSNSLPLKIGVKNTELGKPSDVDFSIFWEAWDKLKEKAVTVPDTNKMVEGSISGLLSSLGDPYTVYFSKKDNERFQEDIQGEFSGIGIEIIMKNNMPTVVTPLSGSPAETAGLKAGDIISEVDGTSTAEITFDETINKIRGPENTKVKLQILRANFEEPMNFEIDRKKITIKSVEWDLKNYKGKKIEYIKLKQFGDDTDTLFKDAADDVTKNNPDAVVLDLRNNPGGYLDTSVSLASYFIEEGIIVSEEGRNASKKDYKAKGGASLAKCNLVVLINNGSASASEILAGALRDRKSVKLIGEKTFGKGSVQELIELSDGSAVKITVAQWFTPNGTQINEKGLSPDIEIIKDDNSGQDNQLERAYQYIFNGE